MKHYTRIRNPTALEPVGKGRIWIILSFFLDIGVVFGYAGPAHDTAKPQGGAARVPFVEPVLDRNQHCFLRETLEESIPADAPVRVFDFLLDQHDGLDWEAE